MRSHTYSAKQLQRRLAHLLGGSFAVSRSAGRGNAAQEKGLPPCVCLQAISLCDGRQVRPPLVRKAREHESFVSACLHLPQGHLNSLDTND